VISLSQVKELELRVGKVVDGLKAQKAENASLKERVAELEAQLEELGNEISNRVAEEAEIEAGIQGILDMLNRVDAPNETNGSEETQAEDNPEPTVDETDSSAEPFSEDYADNFDAQTDGNNPFSASDESDANPMPNEGIHRSGNSEFGNANSGNADDDRFQSEFDIF